MGLLLSNSLDEKSEKIEESTSKQLLSLTGNGVFCPKCRANNKFELIPDDVDVSYLCWNCISDLSVY